MQKLHTHMALVVDEHGGGVGLVPWFIITVTYRERRGARLARREE